MQYLHTMIRVLDLDAALKFFSAMDSGWLRRDEKMSRAVDLHWSF